MGQLNKHEIRIAFLNTGGNSWTGGLTYRKNLFEALINYAPQIKLFYIIDQNVNNEKSNRYYKVIKYPANYNKSLIFVNKIAQRFLGFDFLLRQVLRSLPEGGVDLVFPARYAVGKGIALLAWIPDFQFIHMPEMYSRKQLDELNKKYMQWIERSTLVVLSSKDAQNDLRRFAPHFLNKSRVMNFVAHVPDKIYEMNPEIVITKYNLPKKFIYLPNQFWKHKNHLVVLKALRILKDKGIRPFIVLTGNPIDTRDPLYFADLIKKISLWRLRDQVAILGLVPHFDVYLLIRQAICLLNPSYFEGWSTTVEEAKSIGKCVLLSDLPVHREQNPPASIYFDPQNAGQLANILGRIWKNNRPGPDLNLEHNARSMLPERMKNFANTFVSIAREAIKHISNI